MIRKHLAGPARGRTRFSQVYDAANLRKCKGEAADSGIRQGCIKLAGTAHTGQGGVLCPPLSANRRLSAFKNGQNWKVTR